MENTITIDKKKYVLVPKKQYDDLLLRAARKSVPSKKMSLKEGKKMAHKLIDQWAKEK
ncbi:MAG: hypothetical protein M3342_04355 [Bacteroidota bacterium]|nr:hypothetical protein [Flavisolibacter sp.]MDQ3843232.1 hypothetical protein [Bacteroidota bacterium]